MESVEKELEHIENAIGKDDMNRIDNFFNSIDGYNDDILKEAGMLDIWNKHKVDYADYELGIKIRDCINELGYCEFTAEL